MARVLEGRNRATADEAASFVDEFDRLEQERERKLDEIDAEFKAKKRAINSKINADQKSILTDAKKVGVKKGVIRALADPQKRRRKAQELLERANERADDAIDALEDEDQDFAKDIRKALGDDFASLPLGAAAVEREEARPEAAVDPVAAAAEKAWKDAEPKKGRAAKH
ncbi:MAG: hypothetical protein J0H34_20800 [Rhizobiales bacterium]|nr:hypothetical protein [Hyphomicrobiales bacterium]